MNTIYKKIDEDSDRSTDERSQKTIELNDVFLESRDEQTEEKELSSNSTKTYFGLTGYQLIVLIAGWWGLVSLLL